MSHESNRFEAYLPSLWKTQIAEANAKRGDRFTFAIQTDTHFSELSSPLACHDVKALSHFIDLDFYANLGDLTRGYMDVVVNTPEKMRAAMDEAVRRYLEDANCPVMITVGNHDCNHLWCQLHGDVSQLITEKEHYSRITAPLLAHNGAAMVTGGESNYYYMDFPAKGIRVIMLNSTDGEFTKGYSERAIFSERQVEWFRERALKTDYSVLVMMHIPLLPHFPGNDSSNSINREKVLAAVEEFIAAGGKFIAYLYGHTHKQCELIDENGRLHISFKSGGHVAELVTVDTEQRTVHTHPFGELEPRSWSY